MLTTTCLTSPHAPHRHILQDDHQHGGGPALLPHLHQNIILKINVRAVCEGLACVPRGEAVIAACSSTLPSDKDTLWHRCLPSNNIRFNTRLLHWLWSQTFLIPTKCLTDRKRERAQQKHHHEHSWANGSPLSPSQYSERVRLLGGLHHLEPSHQLGKFCGPAEGAMKNFQSPVQSSLII